MEGIKRWFAQKKKTFLGDRLQDRLYSRKINSETQIRRLCVCAVCCEEVV